MFKFIKNGDSIDLVGEGVAFKNISISVNTEDEKVYTLPITKIEDDLISGGCDKAEAIVKITQKDGVLTLTAEGRLIYDCSKNQFFDNSGTNLSAYGAFSFTFSETVKTIVIICTTESW